MHHLIAVAALHSFPFLNAKGDFHGSVDFKLHDFLHCSFSYLFISSALAERIFTGRRIFGPFSFPCVALFSNAALRITPPPWIGPLPNLEADGRSVPSGGYSRKRRSRRHVLEVRAGTRPRSNSRWPE